MAEKNQKISKQKNANKFTKQQLLNSKKFKNRVDILTVLLKEDILYTIEDTEKEINKFMKGKVN